MKTNQLICRSAEKSTKAIAYKLAELLDEYFGIEKLESYNVAFVGSDESLTFSVNGKQASLDIRMSTTQQYREAIS